MNKRKDGRSARETGKQADGYENTKQVIDLTVLSGETGHADINNQPQSCLGFELFAHTVCGLLQDRFGECASVRIQKVNKNNGIVLTGVSVVKPDNPVSPTVYLESFYERYRKGEETEALAEEIAEFCECSQLPKSNLVEGFMKFGTAKSRIVYKLIGKKKNEELAQKIPHVDYLDMMMVFYYLVEDDSLNNASILIHNSHMELWETGIKELYEAAIANTPRLLPGNIQNMRDLMFHTLFEDLCRNISAEDVDRTEAVREYVEQMVERMFGDDDHCAMYVLTNKKRLFGAAGILYGSLLSDFADQIGQGFYILPSSVHEMILIPEDEIDEPDKLSKMVEEVNREEVPEEEILTDSVYYFDRGSRLVIACV